MLSVRTCLTLIAVLAIQLSRPAAAVDALVVAHDGSGDAMTIEEAIELSPVGGKILVKPGRYWENLFLYKTVHIEGLGNREDIILNSTGDATVAIISGSPSFSNLTISSLGKQPESTTIWIHGGWPRIAGNDISGYAKTVIYVSKDANPMIVDNRIHGGAGVGLYITQRAGGTYRGNKIYGHQVLALWLDAKSNPLFRDNELTGGIRIEEHARGSFIANQISGGKKPAIELLGSADPVFQDNVIAGGRSHGIVIRDTVLGTFERNEVHGHALAAILVSGSASPTLRANLIHDNQRNALSIRGQARGRYLENRIVDNGGEGAPAVWIGKSTRAIFTGNQIHGTGLPTLYREPGGMGTFEDNEVEK